MNLWSFLQQYIRFRRLIRVKNALEMSFGVFGNEFKHFGNEFQQFFGNEFRSKQAKKA